MKWCKYLSKRGSIAPVSSCSNVLRINVAKQNILASLTSTETESSKLRSSSICTSSFFEGTFTCIARFPSIVIAFHFGTLFVRTTFRVNKQAAGVPTLDSIPRKIFLIEERTRRWTKFIQRYISRSIKISKRGSLSVPLRYLIGIFAILNLAVHSLQWRDIHVTHNV